MVVFALFKLLDPVECFQLTAGIFYAYVIRDSEICAPMIAVIQETWALDGANRVGEINCRHIK